MLPGEAAEEVDAVVSSSVQVETENSRKDTHDGHDVEQHQHRTLYSVHTISTVNYKPHTILTSAKYAYSVLGDTVNSIAAAVKRDNKNVSMAVDTQ